MTSRSADPHRTIPLTVGAERVVDSAPEEVYAFLERLDNHTHLNDRYLRVESLRPDRSGGTIAIRAPGGLRRTVATEVTNAVAPRLLAGRLVAGANTRGGASWTIEATGDGALVALEAAILRAGPLDRLLLALGGRWWLERRLERVVQRLGHVLAAAAA